MSTEKITIGADPELFIINASTQDVVSSIGLIPGVKNDAFIPKGYRKGFGIETDNILAEFNIPPAKTEDEFVNNINVMKQWINDFVKSKDPNLTIQCIASRYVNEDQLQSDEAKLFGCDPDFNAYTEDVNPKPEGASTNLRSAGFHVHVGYSNTSVEESLSIVKWMDVFLGVPSVIIDPDTERRKLYGKAGCFRLQPWGVEYRVLSSYMMNNDILIRYVYKQTMAAVSHRNQKHSDLFDIAKNIIDTNDVAGAIEFCKTNKINLI